MAKKKTQDTKKPRKPAKPVSPKTSSRLFLPIASCALGLFIGLLINQPAEQNDDIPLRPTFNFKPLFGSSDDSERDFPRLVPVLKRQGYTVAYDGRSKNPYLVMETITAETLHGAAQREKGQLKEDKQLPKTIRATLDDYRNSGYEKAHLCPPANQKGNPDAQEERYLLTNICPQLPQLTHGVWARFEEHARNLTASYQTVKVFTGPLYLPKTDKDGQRHVSYKVIGKNDVAVPTHFFKVLHLEKESGERVLKGYIFPNETVSSSTPLDKFETAVESIEHASGIIFRT